MKKQSWIYTSLAVFAIGFIISWLLLKNWKTSLIIATISGLMSLTFNPVRRYMKAFWSVFSLLISLNTLSLKFINNNAIGTFEGGVGNTSIVLSVSLILLSLCLLVLDFLERNGIPKLKEKSKSGMNIINKEVIKKQINIEKNEGKIKM